MSNTFHKPYADISEIAERATLQTHRTRRRSPNPTLSRRRAILRSAAENHSRTRAEPRHEKRNTLPGSPFLLSEMEQFFRAQPKAALAHETFIALLSFSFRRIAAKTVMFCLLWVTFSGDQPALA